MRQDGYRIRADKIVGLIWQQADGRTLSEIYEAVSKEKLVSKYFLQIALELMVKADLLSFAGAVNGEKKNSPAPKTSAKNSLLISVIIVNFNGLTHLKELLDSLEGQTYKNVEIIMVDNGSRDGSVSFVRRHWPRVKLAAENRNLGFAAGNNVGLNLAKGEYLFLVNNDTKLEPDCLANLVKTAKSRPEAAAVVPKLKFFSQPSFINAIGNSIGLVGWGSDNYVGYLDAGQFNEEREVFSACFGATLINRQALKAVGLLDEGYRFYYEDSDWSYRARMMGYKIYFAPDAIVYHKFNATMNTLSFNFKLYLLIGNRIRFALKNLQPRLALGFTKRYLKEDLRQFLGAVRRLQARRAYTYLKGWARLTFMLFDIARRRQRVQRSRRPGNNDQELFKLLQAASLLDEHGHPVLTTQAIRSVYMHADIKV